jgi:replicative DNA helicase
LFAGAFSSSREDVVTMDTHDRIFIQRSFDEHYLKQWVEQFVKLLTPQAIQYLEARAIQKTTIEELQIGFQPGKIGFHAESNSLADYFENRIIIPLRNGGGQIVDLIGRSLDNREPKYKSLLGNEETFFNEQIIADSEDIILCNNIFDAIILHQEGIPAICLQSFVSFKVTHAVHLIDKRIMICLGNDELGMRESIRIEALLHEQQIESYIVHLPENVRDINDFFVRAENPLQTFVQLLNQTIEQTMLEPISPDVRNTTVFIEEYMKRFRGVVSGISSGFPHLDQALMGGFRSGLYLLVGSASSGKTMLLKQIADQIASQQIPVIYVSYDLSSFELWARSIARILAVEPTDILNGHINPDLIYEANQQYNLWSQNMWTLEMPMDSTIQYAITMIEKIVMSLGRMPIIFIDHLEKIPYSQLTQETPSIAQYQTMLAFRFKELSREWNCPIVCSLPVEAVHRQLPIGLEVATDVIFELSSLQSNDAVNDQQRMSLELRKHKNGSLRSVHLTFHANRALFTSHA